MKKTALISLLFATTFLAGCAKVALDKPVSLPVEGACNPLFNNGDIVKYKMLGNKQGIVVSRNYKYLTDLNTWYCIVDFYPSSALIHLDFSEFDNYERRYVYEFELELVEKYYKKPPLSSRWKF